MLLSILFSFVIVLIILYVIRDDFGLHKYSLPFYNSKVLINRDFDVEKREAALKPLRMFVEESQKEDRWLSGAFGVATKGIDVRSPFHVKSLETQNKFEDALEKARYGKQSDFEKLKKKVDDAMHTNPAMINDTLTSNQQGALQMMSDGQPIPTVMEGDAIDDMLLTPDEYMKLVPQMRKLTSKPQLFNHVQFSIQTRPGAAERMMEGSLLQSFN